MRHDYLKEKIVWQKNAEPNYPYFASENGNSYLMRLNDFPSESLYTLIVNDVEVEDLDDWPEQWIRPEEFQEAPDGTTDTISIGIGSGYALKENFPVTDNLKKIPELRDLILRIFEKQNELQYEFNKDYIKTNNKWNRSFLIFTSAFIVIISILVWSFIYFNNIQQEKYARLQAENEALLQQLVNKLSDPTTIADLRSLTDSAEIVKTLVKIASIDNDKRREIALEGLRKIALDIDGENRKLALEALHGLIYEAVPGEIITVQIISKKRPASISVDLAGKTLNVEDDSFTFIPSQDEQAGYLVITFKGEIGDVYIMQVSGSKANANVKHIVELTSPEIQSTLIFKSKLRKVV